MSLGSVLALIYGLKQVAEGGMGTTAGLSIIAGAVLGAMFLRRQRRLPDPLIDLRLFRAPAFGASLLTITLALFAAFGAFLFLAQYLQLVLGLSPMEAGLWTLPSSFGLIVGRFWLLYWCAASIHP